MSRMKRPKTTDEDPLYHSSLDLDLSDDSTPETPKMLKKILPAKSIGRPKKIPQYEDTESNAMSKMIQSIGEGLQKTLSAKKRKMEEFADNSLKCSIEKLENFLTKQEQERKKMRVFYAQKIEKSLSEWQSTIDGIKNSTIKIQKLFLQQQKLLDDAVAVQNQKIKLFEQLSKDFVKENDSLENQQKSTQSNIQDDLKSELSLLQKKLLAENQQQQMDKLRKSLTSMY
uniref:XLR/SYCP3/FAM9 domain-containing protein n=1 Tax=Strigamia maritima TaxID=126957 RepID=T1JI46_STRMM